MMTKADIDKILDECEAELNSDNWQAVYKKVNAMCHTNN